jgi:hypothetical protein
VTPATTSSPAQVQVTPTANTLVADPALVTLADDDRPLQVSDVTVNEGSPWAVQTVTGLLNQYVKLDLVSGTAKTESDFGTQLQYFDGNVWVNYVSGTYVKISDASGKLLVRTPIKQDGIFEAAETFKLLATNTGGTSFDGTVTIFDDATGDYWIGDSTSPATFGQLKRASIMLDDDRPLTVNDVRVNEASPFAMFMVRGSPRQQIAFDVMDGTADASDYSKSIEYFDGGDWRAYTPGEMVTLDSGGDLLLRTAIIPDSKFEKARTFMVMARGVSGQANIGTATILDDGTGDYFAASNRSGKPEMPAGVRLADDRPVPPSPKTAAVMAIDRAPTAASVINLPTSTTASVDSASVAPPLLAAAPRLNGLPQGTDHQRLTNGEPIQVDRQFRQIVLPGEQPRLSVYNGVADQFAEKGAQSNFALPYDAFAHTNPAERIALNAKLADGQDLPSWVQFDAQSGRFTFQAPENFEGELRIQVVARDSQGQEAAILFRFHVGDKQATGDGRASLSEKLRAIGQNKAAELAEFLDVISGNQLGEFRPAVPDEVLEHA